jgi:hypothetical protein
VYKDGVVMAKSYYNIPGAKGNSIMKVASISRQDYLLPVAIDV